MPAVAADARAMSTRLTPSPERPRYLMPRPRDRQSPSMGIAAQLMGDVPISPRAAHNSGARWAHRLTPEPRADSPTMSPRGYPDIAVKPPRQLFFREEDANSLAEDNTMQSAPGDAILRRNTASTHRVDYLAPFDRIMSAPQLRRTASPMRDELESAARTPGALGPGVSCDKAHLPRCTSGVSEPSSQHGVEAVAHVVLKSKRWARRGQSAAEIRPAKDGPYRGASYLSQKLESLEAHARVGSTGSQTTIHPIHAGPPSMSRSPSIRAGSCSSISGSASSVPAGGLQGGSAATTPSCSTTRRKRTVSGSAPLGGRQQRQGQSSQEREVAQLYAIFNSDWNFRGSCGREGKFEAILRLYYPEATQAQLKKLAKQAARMSVGAYQDSDEDRAEIQKCAQALGTRLRPV